MNTVAPTTDNLITKDTLTIAVNRKAEYTKEERAFAMEEGLGRLETRWVLVKKPRHESFRTDGNAYRSAGSLYIRTCMDGTKRFVAYMHDESFNHDFQYFDRVINNARFGRMNGWDRYTFQDGSEGWIFDYPNYHVDNLEDFKPAYIIFDDQYDEDSTNVGFGSEWGYPCTESRCRENYHESEDGSHTLESIDYNLTNRGSIEIEIGKDMRAPDSDWYLNIWTAGDLTELTPEEVARFANDLQWMGIECANANNRARILRRNPEATAELMERDQ